MYFKGAYFEKIVDFSNSTFKKLELTNSYLYLPNFNDIKRSRNLVFHQFLPIKKLHVLLNHIMKNTTILLKPINTSL